MSGGHSLQSEVTHTLNCVHSGCIKTTGAMKRTDFRACSFSFSLRASRGSSRWCRGRLGRGWCRVHPYGTKLLVSWIHGPNVTNSNYSPLNYVTIIEGYKGTSPTYKPSQADVCHTDVSCRIPSSTAAYNNKAVPVS